MKTTKQKSQKNKNLRPVDVDTEALAAAVQREAFRRLDLFADGVKEYQNFPPIKAPDPAPAVWRDGGVRLLDYEQFGESAANGPPVLVIPSLINRSHILDLATDRSLMRHFAGAGFHPYLVDWGTPGKREKKFDLDSYITGPLQNAFDFVQNQTGSAPALVGYCMGGLLAMALGQQNLEKTPALALLATPWDFHSDQGAAALHLNAMAPGLKVLIDELGELPVDVLQAMFSGLEPALTGAKFRRFAGLAKDSPEAARFVALEDWLNDGVPLAGPVARQCLFEWYLENTPAKGTWRVKGQVIDPCQLTLPTFVAIPDRDHIVPPASAQALADTLPSAETLKLAAGHIGMVVGSAGPERLYKPLTEWLSLHLR